MVTATKKSHVTEIVQWCNLCQFHTMWYFISILRLQFLAPASVLFWHFGSTVEGFKHQLELNMLTLRLCFVLVMVTAALHLPSVTAHSLWGEIHKPGQRDQIPDQQSTGTKLALVFCSNTYIRYKYKMKKNEVFFLVCRLNLL